MHDVIRKVLTLRQMSNGGVIKLIRNITKCQYRNVSYVAPYFHQFYQESTNTITTINSTRERIHFGSFRYIFRRIERRGGGGWFMPTYST